jgi:hypothetical protein
LASDKPGEVFNTAQVMARLLGSVKLDFHDLVTFVTEEKAPPADPRSQLEKDRDVLHHLGLAGASFFHSAEGAAFADVFVAGCRATWQLSSEEFTDFLLHQFFLENGRAPTAAAMQSALRSLSAYARLNGEQHDVHLRVAESDRRIYIDLGDREWRASKLIRTAGGLLQTHP